MKSSILDLELDFILEEGKFYLTLAGKKIKTKHGTEVYCDSLMMLKQVQSDYLDNRFKSKWLNLISNFADYSDDQININNTYDHFNSYLNNDLLLYIEPESNDYHEFQKTEYTKLLSLFCQIVKLDDLLVPTTGFNKIEISESIDNKFNQYLKQVDSKNLFIGQFLVRISTSSILSILYLAKAINIDEFYNIVFKADIDKQKEFPDLEEETRLNNIKQELDILDYYYNN